MATSTNMAICYGNYMHSSVRQSRGICCGGFAPATVATPAGRRARGVCPTKLTPIQRMPMPMTDEPTTPTTGTVAWFDAGRGVGLISSDDGAPPCAVHAGTLRACGIDSLAAGDRVRFQVRDEDGDRTAIDLALLPAVQRWENEGGAISPDA